MPSTAGHNHGLNGKAQGHGDLKSEYGLFRNRWENLQGAALKKVHEREGVWSQGAAKKLMWPCVEN